MRRIIATVALLAAVIALASSARASGGSGGSYEVRAIFDNGDFLVNGEESALPAPRSGSVASVDVTMPGEWATTRRQPGPGQGGRRHGHHRLRFPGLPPGRLLHHPPAVAAGREVRRLSAHSAACAGHDAASTAEGHSLGQPGAGQRFLPLQNNGKEVDIDLVNNIMREPFADRFRLILNDLGAGLAARGKDLEAIIKRADPALRQTDRILHQLASRTKSSPGSPRIRNRCWRRSRASAPKVAGFITTPTPPAEATAERSAALEAGFQKFPAALQALRRRWCSCKRFADQATPDVRRTSAPAAPSDHPRDQGARARSPMRPRRRS